MGLICWLCGHRWEPEHEWSGHFGDCCSGSITSTKCARCGKTKNVVELSVNIPSETKKDEVVLSAEMDLPAEDVTITTTGVPVKKSAKKNTKTE